MESVSTAIKLLFDQISCQPGVAPVTCAHTVSPGLKTVWGVVQSDANVVTAGGAGGGATISRREMGPALRSRDTPTGTTVFFDGKSTRKARVTELEWTVYSGDASTAANIKKTPTQTKV